MGSPKISVVVPTYNAEEFLAECIESVLAQTLRPTEIIICDDASQDSTVSVAKEYIKKYPEIIRGIFHKENIGIPKNFNSGLKSNTGDFLTMVAGDDYWEPVKIENEYNALKDNPDAGWAFSRVRVLRDGKFSLFNRTVMPEQATEPRNYFLEIFSRRLSPRNILFRRGLVESLGFFSESLTDGGEDLDFKFRLSFSKPGVFIPQYNVIYRQHAGGMHMSIHARGTWAATIKSINMKNRDIIIKAFMRMPWKVIKALTFSHASLPTESKVAMAFSRIISKGYMIPETMLK